MTRHRDRLDLHWSRDTVPDRARLAAILSREHLKDTSLDYADGRQEDLAARHEAAEAMRERVRRRAAAFAARCRTRTGRMDNARCLHPGSATILQVARLALDAVERARLSRRRQSVLWQCARRMVPTALPGPVRPVRPPLAECWAAVFAHAAASLAQLHQLIGRHAHERQAGRPWGARPPPTGGLSRFARSHLSSQPGIQAISGPLGVPLSRDSQTTTRPVGHRPGKALGQPRSA